MVRGLDLKPNFLQFMRRRSIEVEHPISHNTSIYYPFGIVNGDYI